MSRSTCYGTCAGRGVMGRLWAGGSEFGALTRVQVREMDRAKGVYKAPLPSAHGTAHISQAAAIKRRGRSSWLPASAILQTLRLLVRPIPSLEKCSEKVGFSVFFRGVNLGSQLVHAENMEQGGCL